MSAATIDQTVSELAPLLTQIVNEIKKNNISVFEVSNLFTQFIQEKKKTNINNSDITTLLTQILAETNQNNLSNLFSQLLEEKKKTGISNSEITDFLIRIMGTNTKNALTAPEVSNIWSQYMADTLGICVYKYFLNIVEDKELQSILDFALQIAESHINKIKSFFNQDKFQIPMGFTEHDVNLDASRLFSDPFLAFYTSTMTIHGLNAYSLAITTSTREDVRNHFRDSAGQASELFDRAIKYRQARGQVSEPPVIPSPKQVEFVEEIGVISNLFGDKRPLNVSEINNIFFNIKKATLTRALATAFSQAAESEDVRNVMLKVTKSSAKNIHEFSNILEQEHLKPPRMWDNEITNSTVPPFSDKLMMLHLTFLANAALVYYGTGLASSLRPDLILVYRDVIGNVGSDAKAIFTVLLKHGWLEKVPEAIDRKSLAQGAKK